MSALVFPLVAPLQPYGITPPDPTTQRTWLGTYRDYGVGIGLGTIVHNGLSLIAIDVDDDALVDIAALILGDPVCRNQGERGATFFALAEPSVRSTSLKDHRGVGKVDVLAAGKLTVLPPTIHPNTRRPYEWIGKSLLECSFDELPILR